MIWQAIFMRTHGTFSPNDYASADPQLIAALLLLPKE